MLSNKVSRVAEVSVQAPGHARGLTWEEIVVCSKSYGDSFYLFDEDAFRGNFNRLQTAFSATYQKTKIAYSYKTNYTPAVCNLVDVLGGYAEVVSEMELNLARSLGITGSQIIYNGPCKSPRSIQTAMQCGALINIDSWQDYRNVMAIASTLDEYKAVVGIRCNFGMEGRERSRFGIDVDTPEFNDVVKGIRSTGKLVLAGLHCHFADRDLESFRLRTLGILEVAKRLFPDQIGFIDIGGGFFGELPESLRCLQKTSPPSFCEYAEVVGSLCAEAFEGMESPPILFIEPGTALVADTFRFYARVLDIRNVGSRRIATVAGSIQNISPHARSLRLPVRVLSDGTTHDLTSEDQDVDIAGYTCMESDLLTRGLRANVKVGDFLEYSNVGSYSIVMKPPFILPNVPILMLAGSSRSIREIRRREEPDSLFSTFVTKQ